MTAGQATAGTDRRVERQGEASSLSALRPSLATYLAVGLVAGAVIALQIDIMRIFSVGSWAHFGSLVVSIAMLGFGLASAVMSVAKGWFERHWVGVTGVMLILFAPLTIASNLAAQHLPFNAIFLVSDPQQTVRLFANLALYLVPFLAGAVFLGTVFLKANTIFSRVYFADLTGSGLCGLLFLGALYFIAPQDLILVPVLLAYAGAFLWFAAHGLWKTLLVATIGLLLAIGGHVAGPRYLGLTTLAVSDYKGVAYARKFPDARLVYANPSPFGELEVYASSYLHFAPGLSDNAAFNLPEIPANAYLGMYIDGDGPIGIIRDLTKEQTAYFHYLPMIYPYLLKKDPDTFVVQFGGGISTTVALRAPSKTVTVAEGNPAVLKAFRTDPELMAFTGDILRKPTVSVIDYDGRLYLAATQNRYDIIDLSLADSAGLSNPGGFAIVEKYAYSREAMASYMQALKDGGVLSVTLWNKEEPPKSILKLYATMAEAARLSGDKDIAGSFFAVSSYLSTTTVLYKRGGFSTDEVALLRKHTHAMSFDEIYSPGFAVDMTVEKAVLDGFREQIFSAEPASNPAGSTDPAASAAGPDPAAEPLPDAAAGPVVVPATTLGRLAWQRLVSGGWDAFARDYVFDARPLTNDRPYFAAYVKPGDLPRVTDRLEILQDEWGYLLLWAQFGLAILAAATLVLIPLVFGWRTIFSKYPGKGRTVLYFACLGLGYIMVEVGLIARFTLALSNATVSASILITGMLVFSGLGSFVSERLLPRARQVMPIVFVLIGAILFGYGLYLDRILDVIGAYPYALRLALCFALVFPPAFLMGLPMPTAMTSLGRLGKDHMFLWAWGINGCFSVLGAAVVPLVATAFGLGAVLQTAGVAYLLAIPAFFAVLLPIRAGASAGAA